jgi:hypothetical protein
MTFNNNSSQKERAQVLRNDRDCLHTRYQDEAGGRFKRQVPTQISGSNPATLYPKLPASSPWSSDPVPPEEPLGIDVGEPVITGEPHELEASLNSDLGWRKTIQEVASSAACAASEGDGASGVRSPAGSPNGVPPAAGGLIPASSGPTPDAEATRANLTKERTSLASSAGRHSITQRRVSPNNSNIKRRLR